MSRAEPSGAEARAGAAQRSARVALAAVALVATLAALVAGILWGGLEGFRAPLTSRIFYVHVPSAWVAYGAFAATAVASAMVLMGRRTATADTVALAAAEVGALFGGVALVTGAVWARAEFGGDYSLVRDPKLVTTLVLELAYLGYLALRRGVDDPPRRARLAAVYGIAALVGVPASYLANRAATPHPDFLAGTTLAPDAVGLLLASLAAFTLLAISLVWLRADLARVEARLEGDLDG